MRLPSAEGACVRAIGCYVLRLTPMGSCRTKAMLFMGQDTRLSLRGLGIVPIRPIAETAAGSR
jgi:hypothetical protein